LGDQVLELGAGIGNFTGRLMSRRLHYVAAERDPLYLHALHNRFFRTPSVSVRSMDPERAEDYTALRESFDTVVCLNVIEYAENPEIVLRGANSVLAPGGSLVLLVPQGEALYGSLDRTLGHRRRFQATQLTRLLEMCGFAVERSLQLNKISTLAWWVNSRVLSSRHISKPTLKIFDKTVWLWRRLDPLIPWRGLSLVIIARKRAAAAGEVQREPMQNKLSSVLK
jgi:SAM-dependent methyltransferase